MNVFYSIAKSVYQGLAANHPQAFCKLKALLNHSIQENQEFWDLYTAALRESATVQPFEDFFNLFQSATKTRRLPGDIAELGVYRGGSAKLIASLKGEKRLHLFDTFEGMPEVRPDVDRFHASGDFAGDWLESTKRYLKNFSNIFYYKGLFPDSAQELGKTPTRFSLVHLDPDIYASTKAGLEFFYPRMVSGGIIIAHDYRNLACPGVRRAFDEFFAEKPEIVLELWKTQCLVVKQ
jgi:O-methyltransferase